MRRLNNVLKQIVIGSVVVLGVAMMPKPAQAAAIVGSIDLAGGIRVTEDGLLDFFEPLGGGFGEASVEQATGYFSQLNPIGSFEYSIREADLNALLFPPSTFPGEANGGFAELLDFETTPDFLAQLGPIGDPELVDSPYETLTFSLTQILPCEFGCDLGFSPHFSVEESGGSVGVTMNIRGIVCDEGDPDNGLAEGLGTGTGTSEHEQYVAGDCTPYIGKFTAQFAGTTAAALIALLESQGYIETSFSASKISVGGEIPEPATLLLFGAGAAALAARQRRKTRKQQA